MEACLYHLCDEVNRLAIAAEGAAPTGLDQCPGGAAWCRDYRHDAFGNRAMTGTGAAQATPSSPSDFNTANNRITAATYDLAGNLTDLAGVGAMSYDANNKMVAYDNANASLESTGQYFYDGNGNRMKRITSQSEGKTGTDSILTGARPVCDPCGSMPRIARVVAVGVPHHVTQRCDNRQTPPSSVATAG